MDTTHCGQCILQGVAYSSTGFVLSGLVLAAHTESGDWTKMSTKDFFPPATQALLPDTHFFTNQPFTKWLTTPGRSCGYNTTTKKPAKSYPIYLQVGELQLKCIWI